eukprot:CAMPEP_0181451198 /NCGR_PEP_ID=MMETSP1110-20121109/28566_1 /TAXON_ID=174948 /ORGANISM="Symbiodinium sp., Strain CCMP421" /LENGTH=204 /DNA_ID=CAMNT_0023575439 /DNA_START=52 /DNA_END=667 /DNA_ORIENTATION=-
MSFLRPLILAFAAVPCLEAIVWNGKDGSDSNVVAAIDLSSIPDCTDDLIAGGEAQCDSLSKDECKGYTQWDDSGKLFIQCKPSGENCLAEGPQCKKPPKKNHWIKPKAGVVCTQACKDNGFTKCNKKEMAKIDSKEKVKKAMKEAGTAAGASAATETTQEFPSRPSDPETSATMSPPEPKRAQSLVIKTSTAAMGPSATVSRAA